MKNPLPRSLPENQGVSSAAILAFVEAVEAQIHELHSLMLVRRGAVVAEGWWAPYAPERLHMLFSLSKSFTSTAIGLAVGEGRLALDDTVISFFPDDLPEKVTARLAQMQVRHLISMSTGHSKDTTEALFRSRDGNWVKAFLARPVKYKPGTHFLYNTGATYMLSAIIQKTTGMKLLDYLQPRLLEPLGIEDADWETCPRGINTGGFGLRVHTEDIAKFGQLYLQKGLWNGRRLLPEGWVELASAKHIDNGDNPESDWNQGYGFQFWRCRHEAYRGDGAFGQYCIVMPEQDAVLAITSGLGDMQVPLNLVWQHLLPAFSVQPLPDDPQAQAQLKHKLAGLHYDPPAGESASPAAVQITGKVFKVGANEQKIKSLSFEFGPETAVITTEYEGHSARIECGYARWLETGAELLGRGGLLGPGAGAAVAASGVWETENTFTVTTRFFETPFFATISYTFQDRQVEMKSKMNVSFGPLETPVVVGHLKGN
jgi:CubicO group peptidase (beta-lactamase class C family)